MKNIIWLTLRSTNGLTGGTYIKSFQFWNSPLMKETSTVRNASRWIHGEKISLLKLLLRHGDCIWGQRRRSIETHRFVRSLYIFLYSSILWIADLPFHLSTCHSWESSSLYFHLGRGYQETTLWTLNKAGKAGPGLWAAIRHYPSSAASLFLLSR